MILTHASVISTKKYDFNTKSVLSTRTRVMLTLASMVSTCRVISIHAIDVSTQKV
jgi:hypothetical protein